MDCLADLLARLLQLARFSLARSWLNLSWRAIDPALGPDDNEPLGVWLVADVGGVAVFPTPDLATSQSHNSVLPWP